MFWKKKIKNTESFPAQVVEPKPESSSVYAASGLMPISLDQIKEPRVTIAGPVCLKKKEVNAVTDFRDKNLFISVHHNSHLDENGWPDQLTIQDMVRMTQYDIITLDCLFSPDLQLTGVLKTVESWIRFVDKLSEWSERKPVGIRFTGFDHEFMVRIVLEMRRLEIYADFIWLTRPVIGDGIMHGLPVEFLLPRLHQCLVSNGLRRGCKIIAQADCMNVDEHIRLLVNGADVVQLNNRASETLHATKSMMARLGINTISRLNKKYFYELQNGILVNWTKIYPD